MNDAIPLPTLQHQILDDATLHRLRDDLLQLAQLIEVKTRDADSPTFADLWSAISDAFAKLAAGRTRGVQIRYRHEGQTWWDTLMPTAAGVRLTRVCVDELNSFSSRARSNEP
jgi:hypothetical protein